MKAKALLFLISSSAMLQADLTTQQKIDDFRAVASIYQKEYGPYEWKIEAFRFDAFDLAPWLDQIRRSRNDIEYLDILVRYVSSLRDSHSRYLVPSNFTALLGFTVDIYDGKVLIDSINPGLLPAARYPFQIGDELVSLDGKTAEQWIEELLPYSNLASNPSGQRRSASNLIVQRSQILIPAAHLVGESAAVVIRRRSGDTENYTIPWTKVGTPTTSLGTLPDLRAARSTEASRAADADEPDYVRLLREIQNVHMGQQTVLNGGGLQPIFRMPAGFQQRLGRIPTEQFFSGVYQAEGKRIGFIRIPAMTPFPVQIAPGVGLVDFNQALNLFFREVIFMQQNTDALIIDVMRNPGGSVAYVEGLLQSLIPQRFRSIGFEVRASLAFLRRFETTAASAQAAGAPAWQVNLLTSLRDQMRSAFAENRGRTGPVSLTGVTFDLDPIPDNTGASIAYTKPILVLADEFSGSGGDMFPAVIQDNGRGKIFGMRTTGAGGSVMDRAAGPLSEGTTRVTVSLMNRRAPIVTPDLPTAPYVENIGVRPDIVNDYMTAGNLLNGGQPFVQAFTSAILAEIQ